MTLSTEDIFKQLRDEYGTPQHQAAHKLYQELAGRSLQEAAGQDTSGVNLGIEALMQEYGWQNYDDYINWCKTNYPVLIRPEEKPADFDWYQPPSPE